MDSCYAQAIMFAGDDHAGCLCQPFLAQALKQQQPAAHDQLNTDSNAQSQGRDAGG